MRKLLNLSFLISILLLLTACKEKPASACPPRTDEEHYLSSLDIQKLAPVNNPSPNEVEINGRMTTVDQVVSGPLCNGYWSGTVYVACDVQVARWEEKPLFLKDCNLSIEPDTVVYVAYHNDAAYYKGCSCHVNEEP
jgi:hypothetical protein